MTFKMFFAGAVAMLFGVVTPAQEWKSGVDWQEPPVVSPGHRNSDAPSDAIVLFDGTTLSEWDNGDQWVVEDGVAIPEKINISTKRSFADIQLHLEWAAPKTIEGDGQGRGNSGVFLMGLYEVQILDSYKNLTYFDGQAGSVYKQTPPMANAMRRPGKWNTYDIFFKTPEFATNGELIKPAYLTVLHNGILVQHHFELLGPTAYLEAPHYVAHADKGPIMLQNHHDAVRYRNIWVRELVPPQGHRVSAPFTLPAKADVAPADED
ncbi:MAG: DUF1080 domain-containing protein [Fuerstiella sp.]|nr:DUF1080 domain-containing protein [Fuerstiella sp.]